MKHKIASSPYYLARALFLIALVVMVSIEFVDPPKALAVGNVPDNIRTMLIDYSQYLNSGKTTFSSSYSDPMVALVKNRRDYYSKFFSIGLHTNLSSISSEFHTETAKVSLLPNIFRVKITETVKMFGQPDLNKAEDYPMIPAARWAISKTDNESVKQALEQYIVYTTDGVNESINNGVEITFRVHHSIDMVAKGGQVQVSRDQFTDKEIDNGDGFDNVIWVNDNLVRSEIDLTQMPDYIIYHTPIEILGQQLLDDYTKAYGGKSPNAVTNFTYNRTAAKNYALTYTSNTPYTTCTGVYQQTSYYNSIYETMWDWTGCDDCADFVSQSLKAGGFPVDSKWKYSGTDYSGAPGTYAWRVFDWTNGTWPNGTPKVGLAHYLKNVKQAINVMSSYTSLLSGDLMYTNDQNLHVVMVTSVAPTRFSGHTNDRRNYPYVSSLTKFWQVKSTIP